MNFKEMSPELKLIYDMVKSDHHYYKMYPDARELNVFSVSRLAWNWKDVVDMKLHPNKRGEWNGKMLVGKLLGKQIQDEFVRQDERWFTEQPEVRYNIPYRWKCRPLLRGITLIGHPDLVHHERRIVAELKTSPYSDVIHPYAIQQNALYWAYLLRTTGKDYAAKVLKVSWPPNEVIMTRKQKEEGAQEIVRRAYLAAKELDRSLSK